jgi:NitT/TauT family transport system substrate-binding protein
MKILRSPALVASIVALLCAPAGAADKVTLALGWLPTGSNAYFYMAKEGGYFAAENLDVQILPGKGASDAMTKLAGGIADFAEAGVDALLTAKISTDLPLKAVMPIYTMPPDALVTTTSSGVKSLKDLPGRRVATSPFTQSNGPWPFILKLNGVDPASVTLIKADPNALVPMLAAGQVEGVIQFTTNAPLSEAVLKEAGKKILVLPWSDYGMSGYSNSLVVSDKTIATRRDVVVRFMSALKKAIEAERDHPEKAAAALKASVPETDVDIAEKMIRLVVPLVFNASTDQAGLGKFSPTLVAATWEWVANGQNVPTSKFDPMSVVDTSLVK